MRIALPALALAGCAWGGSTDSHGILGTDARVRMDARPIDTSMPIDTPITPPMGYVLLTEIALNPVGGEFIEIHNPSAQSVALDQYYLADTGEYWKQPVAAPTLNDFDFIVRFPAGSMIAAGATQTISIGTAAAFTTAYPGVTPTYAVTGGTLVAVNVGITPTLTDGGEIVVLFKWDGANELVKDGDMMLAGVPSAINGLVSKSGVMQGSSTYAADADTIAAQPTAPTSGFSTKRTMLEGANETHAASNGISGDDETSEKTNLTWDTTFTAPTPGAVPTF